MSVKDRTPMAGNYFIPEGCKHHLPKAILVLKIHKCSKFDTQTLSKGKKSIIFLLASHPKTFQDFLKSIYIYIKKKKEGNSFFLSSISHQHTYSFIRGSQFSECSLNKNVEIRRDNSSFKNLID